MTIKATTLIQQLSVESVDNTGVYEYLILEIYLHIVVIEIMKRHSSSCRLHVEERDGPVPKLSN